MDTFIKLSYIFIIIHRLCSNSCLCCRRNGYFGFKVLKFEYVLKIWFFILAAVVIDAWIQFTFGKNIFGIEIRGAGGENGGFLIRS